MTDQCAECDGAGLVAEQDKYTTSVVTCPECGGKGVRELVIDIQDVLELIRKEHPEIPKDAFIDFFSAGECITAVEVSWYDCPECC